MELLLTFLCFWLRLRCKVIWVTPTNDATICVDYDNDGNPDNTTDILRLESQTFIDPDDDDMSGALVWAVAYQNDCSSSNIVPIALAWGQSPFRTDGSYGLDAGCKCKVLIVIVLAASF